MRGIGGCADGAVFENIILENINLTAYDSFMCSKVENMTLNNIQIRKELKNDKII